MKTKEELAEEYLIIYSAKIDSEARFKWPIFTKSV
jgi:hypothetical protein